MLSKRAEDPEYIKEKNLKIDSNYYIKNQLLPPLERIFSVIGVDKGELLGMGRQYSLKEMLSSACTRDYEVKLSPTHVKIKNPENFICTDCDKNFRRVPLTGRCDCGGKVLAEGNGNIGELIEIAA